MITLRFELYAHIIVFTLKRLTRSAVRKLASKEKEVVDVWALGKKLGLYAENEEAVLKELPKDGAPNLLVIM